MHDNNNTSNHVSHYDHSFSGGVTLPPAFKALPDYAPIHSSSNILDHFIDDLNVDIAMLDRERRNSSGREHDIIEGKIQGLQVAKYKMQALNSCEKNGEILLNTKFGKFYEPFTERSTHNPLVVKRKKE